MGFSDERLSGQNPRRRRGNVRAKLSPHVDTGVRQKPQRLGRTMLVSSSARDYPQLQRRIRLHRYRCDGESRRYKYFSVGIQIHGPVDSHYWRESNAKGFPQWCGRTRSAQSGLALSGLPNGKNWIEVGGGLIGRPQTFYMEKNSSLIMPRDSNCFKKGADTA